MSPQGCPQGEHRSAQREGGPVSPQGRPKGKHRSARREGAPMSPQGRLKGDTGVRSAKVLPKRAAP